MKKNINNNIIYLSQWKNHSIDEMIEIYVTPRRKVLNPLETMKYENPEEPIYEYENLRNVDKEKLRLKFISMCDMIINRCYGCKGSAKFNAKVFHHLYGDYYRRMLQVLEQLKLIEIDYQYKRGSYSRTIRLVDWKTTTIKINNATLLKYKDKLKDYLSQLNNRKHLPKTIASRYKAALKFVILDKEKALEYINDKYSGNCEMILGDNKLNNDAIEGYKKWRIGFINGFTTNEELKQDNNGRIYHPLTNMPKDLLPFTNVLYEMDAANCHPMLFVKELINYYKIDKETLLYISEYPIPNNEDFYDNYQSIVKQISNNIKCKIPNDVIEYILLVFKGKFWDYNLRKYDVNDRSEIKTNFFSQVFYSYNNRIVNRDKYDSKSIIIKQYAKDFKKYYPNVWKVLGIIKKNGKKQLIEEKKKEMHMLNGMEIRDCDIEVKNNILPNSMMKIESQIFIKILRNLLSKYDVINIHDAICVIDTPKNKSLTEDEIRKVMLNVFKKYTLYPTIKKSIPTKELLEDDTSIVE